MNTNVVKTRIKNNGTSRIICGYFPNMRLELGASGDLDDTKTINQDIFSVVPSTTIKKQLVKNIREGNICVSIVICGENSETVFDIKANGEDLYAVGENAAASAFIDTIIEEPIKAKKVEEKPVVVEKVTTEATENVEKIEPQVEEKAAVSEEPAIVAEPTPEPEQTTTTKKRGKKTIKID